MEYASLREKIAAEGAARKARYANFAAAYDKAAAAGKAAGEARVPRAMVVIDEMSGQRWHEAEGLCGFAWVNVYPGTSSFARWLVKNKLASRAYNGGVQIWVSAFNQSVERKEACANAMAEVLRTELGVKAYAGSRLD